MCFTFPPIPADSRPVADVEGDGRLKKLEGGLGWKVGTGGGGP